MKPKVGRIVCLIFFCLVFSLFSCSLIFYGSEGVPRAADGMIDLTSWDFERHGNVTLDGMWEFYWNELLEPGEFQSESERFTAIRKYGKVPGLWNTYDYNGKTLPWFGYGTFRLVVKLPEQKARMGIKVFDASTAYRLWLDGTLLLSNGRVGRTRKEMKPQYLPSVTVFDPGNNGTVEIVVQVSNFFEGFGGIWKSILIGKEWDILNERDKRIAFELFLSGVLFVIGIYHIVLFLMGKNDRSLLFFGIFCFDIMARVLVTGERFLYQLFVNFDWQVGTRIELFTVYIGVPLFLWFLLYLFPKECHRTIHRIFLGIGVLWAVAICFVHSSLFDIVTKCYQIILVIACLYSIVIIIFAIVRKRDGAGFILIGIIIFVLTIVNDILTVNFIIRTNLFAPLGLFFFILCAFALYEKFVRAEEQLRLQQEQLIHADKLISLGTLVAGVAHEINNPNNAIMLTSETGTEMWKGFLIVLDEYCDALDNVSVGGLSLDEMKEEIGESFKRILRSSRRIKFIVEELKKFSRKDAGTPLEEIDINTLIQSSISLVENKIKKSTQNFHVAYGENIPIFAGNYQRLEQVLVNLIQNACDALSDTTQGISISTAYDNQVREIIIIVKDEGEGMDKETLKRVFDPFYTTKRADGGTGLGLAVSASIVKEHNGSLTFESAQGKGTTARLVFQYKE
jgi:signal transduction histidine kinase